jgi:hypothetical protein
MTCKLATELFRVGAIAIVLPAPGANAADIFGTQVAAGFRRVTNTQHIDFPKSEAPTARSR